MGKLADRLAGQIKAAMHGPAWHGPALFEIIDDLSAEEASAKPLSFAHSIWEIVLHLNAWDKAIPLRLGDTLVELTGDDDWPPCRDTSAAAWNAMKSALQNDSKQLRDAIRALSDDDLNKSVPGHPFDNYVMLSGIPQHILYHSGQIALLKKALRA